MVFNSSKIRFPEQANQALGSFFFLRFICPAIIAPHVYGLQKGLQHKSLLELTKLFFLEPPNEAFQRQLVLLSKVIQGLANNVGKNASRFTQIL